MLKNYLILFYFILIAILVQKARSQHGSIPRPLLPTGVAQNSNFKPMLELASPNTRPSVTVAPLDVPIGPKCFPETAVAYFLPGPTVAPKVTVLNTNLEELMQSHLNPNAFTQPSANLPPKLVGAAPPSYPEWPELMEEIPSLLHDRFSRLAETETVIDVPADVLKVSDKPKTNNIVDKLPIFSFDEELLDGFLTGIGM